MRSPKRALEDPDVEQAAHRARLNAMLCQLQASCKAPSVPEDEEYVHEDEDDFTRTREEHLEKIEGAGDGKEIVRVVPRSSATTRVLSGRWVDTKQMDGTKKSRWTTRGFEQEIYGHENHVAGTPAMAHLKAMLVNAEVHGHVVALGDCSGAFYVPGAAHGGEHLPGASAGGKRAP